MKTNYTQGPWTATFYKDAGIWGARNPLFAVANCVENAGEDEANARLISAAPDLLEACKEFVRKCECGEARSKRSYAQMKEAIAKAEPQPTAAQGEK